MKITKTNVKSLLGITTTTNDTKIDIILPQLVDELIKYCNQHFVKKGSTEYIYDDCDMVFVSDTCTFTSDIILEAGDWIRIDNTELNNGLYQVKSYTGGVLTVESANTFTTETITSGMIQLLDLPQIFLSIIAGYIDNYIVNNRENVANERIDDYSITFKNSDIVSFIQQHSQMLNHYRSPFEIKFIGNLYINEIS